MIEERLTSKELAGLEADFVKIANIENLIRRREIEIEWPYREFKDENVGGSRSSISIDKAQAVLEKKEKDNYLQRLYRLRDIKDQLLGNKEKQIVGCMTDQQREIYKLRFESDDYYDWLLVGELLEPKLKRAQIYRKRGKLLELLAKKEGILPE
ncbi:transcriptional regulator [Liquorilactobacillus satsumensis]|uniref:transcriptional regulator n=1 Tax=Liquorilactobacillus satsumensis TaxID=259059 RepID=UPI0039E97D1E